MNCDINGYFHLKSFTFTLILLLHFPFNFQLYISCLIPTFIFNIISDAFHGILIAFYLCIPDFSSFSPPYPRSAALLPFASAWLIAGD